MRHSWVLAVAVLGMAGCDCADRRIDVNLPATVETGGQTRSVNFDGGIRDHDAGANFETLVDIVEDAAAASGGRQEHTLLWTMTELGGSGLGTLSFAMRVPVAPGDTVSVSLGTPGGGWGVLSGEPRPTPLTATVALARSTFVPNAARGTLRVLRTAPLQLAVDVTFFDGASNTLRVQGSMAFTVSEVETPCFT
jgi:hypothetical protein